MKRPDSKIVEALWKQARPEVVEPAKLIAAELPKALEALAEACYKAGVERGYDLGWSVFRDQEEGSSAGGSTS